MPKNIWNKSVDGEVNLIIKGLVFVSWFYGKYYLIIYYKVSQFFYLYKNTMKAKTMPILFIITSQHLG